MSGLILGRRPVVDADLAVVGYRLVLSGGEPTSAAARVGGLAPVFGSAAAFFQPGRSFLAGFAGPEGLAGLGCGEPLPVPLERAVLEVEADLATDGEAMEGLRALVRGGARVALHRTHGLPCPQDLLEMAHFVFLHRGDPPGGLAFRLQFDAELAATIALSGACGARVIALDVDSAASMNEARNAGYDLFEGRILSRPTAVATQPMTPSRTACFQMLQKVNDPDTSAAEIERIVETDPGLSYRILHVSGLGVAGGLRREVRSIREAAVLLGREWIQKWLLMMVAADANEGTADQLSIAMIRARMCELLASAVCPPDTAAGFTVGLISAMDLLLGWDLPVVVSKLALTSELKAAVLGRDGTLGDILGDVLAWLDGEAEPSARPPHCGVGAEDIEAAYLDGLRFASEVSSFLSGSSG